MQLFIENIEVPILNKIALTKSGYFFEDWDIRILNYSQNVQIAKNSTTDNLFKRASDVSAKANKFNRYYNFVCESSGTIIFSGLAILVKASNVYEVQLIDSAKSFFDSLSGNLNELDFENDDIIFNQDAYDNLKLFSNSVWVWPVILTHSNRILSKSRFESGAGGLKFSRPSFSVKSILNKIFSANKWTSKLKGLDILDSLCITSNDSDFFVTSYQKTFSETINVEGTKTVEGLDSNDFEYTVASASTQLNIFDKKTIFRLRGSINASANFTIKIKGISDPLSTDQLELIFYIRKGNFDYDFTTSEYSTTEANNLIQFIIEGQGQISFSNFLFYTLIEEQSLGDLNLNLLQGYKVKVFDNLPTFTQLSFLKNIFGMFGAFIYSDNLKNELRISSINTVRKLNSVDWSSKFIVGSESVDSTPQNYARVNWLVFDNDETISKFLGSSSFVISDNTRNETSDIYTNIHSASHTAIVNNYAVGDLNVYSDTVRINSINNRILETYLSDDQLFSISDFENIDFDSIQNTYLKTFIESINNAQIVTASFNLSRSDFFEFDFSKSVYIEYLQSCFYLFEIESFIEGELTTCKLLKI